MSKAIFISESIRSVSNEYNNLQANTIICNIDDYELNQQITGQFLIGILIWRLISSWLLFADSV